MIFLRSKLIKWASTKCKYKQSTIKLKDSVNQPNIPNPFTNKQYS